MMAAIERMPVNPDYTSLSAQLSKCSVIELNPEEGDNQAAIAASNSIWRRVVAANEAKAKAKAASAASEPNASKPAVSAAASKSAIKYAAASAAAAAAASSCKEKTEPVKQKQRPQPAFNATAAFNATSKPAYAPTSVQAMQQPTPAYASSTASACASAASSASDSGVSGARKGVSGCRAPPELWDSEDQDNAKRSVKKHISKEKSELAKRFGCDEFNKEKYKNGKNSIQLMKVHYPCQVSFGF